MTQQTCSQVTASVIDRINKEFDKLLVRNKSGKLVPRVCTVCDEFLLPHEEVFLPVVTLEKNKHVLDGSKVDNLSTDLTKCYKHTELCERNGSHSWLSKLMLSPRGLFYDSTQKRGEGFSSCEKCKRALDKNSMPKFAIANNYCFGNPPSCLLELTEVELAVLTPIRTHGYCFSYTGGVSKQLKGSLSYFKRKIPSIVNSVAQLDVVGLQKDIIVVLCGTMTPEQREVARAKNRLRVEKVLEAMKWLIQHNEEWRKLNLSLDEIKEKLTNPQLIEDVQQVPGGDDDKSKNVETTETFKVFFPDGTVDETNGGQDSINKFRSLVSAMKENHFNVEMICDLQREAVPDYKDNNLVNACLLQFPYGRGGMHERRVSKRDGTMSNRVDAEEHVNHLSKVSLPHFQGELFSLILCNIHVKQRMLRNATFQCRGKLLSSQLSRELTEKEVAQAVERRRGHGESIGGIGNSFLKAVDATTRAVPHTNAATKSARLSGEAINHSFGMANWFLTWTPDDENSIIVQAYSGVVIDDGTPIDHLSDAQLRERAKARRTLRIRSPGVCAFFFEAMLQIVVAEVIGWDSEKGQSTDKGGLFGKPEAFIIAVEEQGRRTLHGHAQIWIEGMKSAREDLFGNKEKKRKAEQLLCKKLNEVASCNLMGEHFKRQRRRGRGWTKTLGWFPHLCKNNVNDRDLPQVCDDQTLRYLRYSVKEATAFFAKCPHCNTTWNNEAFVESFLKEGLKMNRLTCFPDNEVNRLKAKCVQHQMSGEGGPNFHTVVDAAYNLHGHTRSSCFKKASKKKEGEKGKKRKAQTVLQECRFRCPKSPQRATTIIDTSDTQTQWFEWHGSHTMRHNKEILLKRFEEDTFQNESCTAISQSKMTCNSNLQQIMPGPVGAYTFKYGLETNAGRRFRGVRSSQARHDKNHFQRKKARWRPVGVTEEAVGWITCPSKEQHCWSSNGFFFDKKQLKIFVFS